MLARFDQQQRELIARLLAHKWYVSSVDLRNTEGGGDYSHTVTGGESCETGELSAAIRDVLAELRRRTTSEGGSIRDDDLLVEGELAGAAGCYAMNYSGSFGIHDYKDDVPMMWPHRRRRGSRPEEGVIWFARQRCCLRKSSASIAARDEQQEFHHDQSAPDRSSGRSAISNSTPRRPVA